MENLPDDHMINHPWLIGGFAIAVVIMLLLDLGVFNKKSHTISNKEALTWSIVWITLSMVFSGIVYFVLDKPHGITDNFSKYQAAYWIEKALSVDNLFVFILVFKFFKIPKEYQHKVLFWGILGALFFRAIFIFAGVQLIKVTYITLPFLGINPETGDTRQLNVVLFIFGIFLIIAGIKSALPEKEGDEENMSKNIGVRLVHKFFKVSPDFDGDKFFTIQNGIKMVTPLFVALAVIEITDLVFAVDSIPAIFAIAPDDPFILYTSNIFAILGLRSLYFLLANSMDMFSKLHYGLAVILVFIGTKMLIMPFYHFQSTVSLAIIGGVLSISIIASLMYKPKND
ncbi:TerC family protein [Paenimyroides tangerinum]|uniref:TerC family protein n=1 Tax=Paenimyroides tangerinum TaxID=2488728 RepID=A0A3P3W2W7_9FLAO|nr:TerC family protein [Paenimyroides tangerinum]RRJ89074.1 TerC family protein [Paenimyroides tangerinum]